MALQETLLIGSVRTPTDSLDASVPAILLLNLHTLSPPLASYKRSFTTSSGLARTSSHLFAAQSDKSVLNIYPLPQSTSTATKITTSAATSLAPVPLPLPAPPTIVSASPDDAHVAFTLNSSPTVYIWSLALSRLSATPALHLQPVTALTFSAHGTMLISGSADSTVQIYSVPALLDVRGATRTPLHTLTRHYAPITALAVGRAGAGGGGELLVTADSSGEVACWTLGDARHLKSFLLPVGVSALAVDPAERGAWVGCTDGSVVRIELLSPTGSMLDGGEGSEVPLTLTLNGDDDAEGTGTKVDGAAVTALQVSADGSLLVVGDESGKVTLRDGNTGGVWKTITDLKAPIATLHLHSPFPPSKPTSFTLPTVPKPRYEDILNATAVTRPEWRGVAKVQLDGWLHEDGDEDGTFGPEYDLAMVSAGAAAMQDAPGALVGKARVQRLEEELRDVYEMYERLNEVHKRTWEFAIKSQVQGQSQGGGDDEMQG